MTPFFDPARHLRQELIHLGRRLGQALALFRGRSRGGIGEAINGVIEDSEADLLVTQLTSPPERASAPGGASDNERQAFEEAAIRQGARLPLRHLRAAFALTPVEYEAVLLAVAVELDTRFARLVAYLNDHASRARPTFGVVQLMAECAGQPWDLSLMSSRPLVVDGLIEVDGDGPSPTQSIRLSSGMVTRLMHGVNPELPAWASVHHDHLDRFSQLVLTDHQRRLLTVWVEQVRKERLPPAVLLVGAAGSGRGTIATATAGAAGLPLVSVELGEGVAERLRLARREARWHRAALLLQASSPISEWQAVWRLAESLALPMWIALPPEQRVAALAVASHQPLEIPCGSFTAPERARLWQQLLPPGEPLTLAELEPLAGRYRRRPGDLQRAVRRAQVEVASAPAGERRLTPQRLGQALRALAIDSLGILAQRLPTPFERSDLVVSESINRELDLAVAWVAGRTRVLEEWGLGRRMPYGRGLTALFSGSPGTGKTMAAQVLARQLGLDCYRVDLSQVVNKYIGETEKNLGRLFDLAAETDVVLFFDEADALFGKRSEVKDAHDRYANLEVGYLLQRIEAHDGITILASNRGADLDEAFIRRFHIILDFPRPTVPDRVRLWDGLLVSSVPRGDDVDLPALARAFELSGGEIKNCVLAAAYLAAAANLPVGMAYLVAAVQRELLKNGRLVDERTAQALLSGRSAPVTGVVR